MGAFLMFLGTLVGLWYWLVAATAVPMEVGKIVNLGFLHDRVVGGLAGLAMIVMGGAIHIGSRMTELRRDLARGLKVAPDQPSSAPAATDPRLAADPEPAGRAEGSLGLYALLIVIVLATIAIATVAMRWHRAR